MTNQTAPKVGFFGAISEIRRWVILLLIGLVLFFGYKYFTSDKDTSSVEYDTALIQEQIKNVGKLVVTEGHFLASDDLQRSKKVFGRFDFV